MTSSKAFSKRATARRARAVAESCAETRFYGKVPEPVLCPHAHALRAYHNGVLVFLKCYDCGLEIR